MLHRTDPHAKEPDHPKTVNRQDLAMSTLPIKRVAVIGAGPAGAIAIDALAQEKAFDIIRVFERREGPGGCWYGLTPSSSSMEARHW